MKLRLAWERRLISQHATPLGTFMHEPEPFGSVWQVLCLGSLSQSTADYHVRALVCPTEQTRASLNIKCKHQWNKQLLASRFFDISIYKNDKSCRYSTSHINSAAESKRIFWIIVKKIPISINSNVTWGSRGFRIQIILQKNWVTPLRWCSINKKMASSWMLLTSIFNLCSDKRASATQFASNWDDNDIIIGRLDDWDNKRKRRWRWATSSKAHINRALTQKPALSIFN